MRILLTMSAVACGLALAAAPRRALAASILTEDERSAAASLGVRTLSLPQNTTNALGLPVPGLRVVKVDPAGPTAAVLQPHDILQQVNDQLLFNPPQLEALLQTLRPGETVTVWRVRDGGTQAVDVTLGTLSALPDAAADRAAEDVDGALPPTKPAWNTDAQAPVSLDAAQVAAVMNHIRESFAEATPSETLDDTREAQFMEELQRRLEDSSLAPPTTNPDDYRRRKYAPHVPSEDLNPITKGSANGRVTLIERDGQRIITVQDANGVVLFEGPAEMQEGRSQLPPSVWKQFYEMERRGLTDPAAEDAP